MPTVSPVGRASFPALFVAEKNDLDPSKDDRYKITLLFDKGDPLTAIREEIERVAQEKWGSDRPAKWRNPIQDGDEKTGKAADSYAGNHYIDFWRYKGSGRPDVKGPQKQNLSAGELVAGDYVRVSYEAYAYGGTGVPPGVNLGLCNVQKVKDGEPFGVSRTTGDEDFEEVAAAAGDKGDLLS